MPMPHTGICDYRIRAYATIEYGNMRPSNMGTSNTSIREYRTHRYGNIERIDTGASNMPTNASGYIPLGRVEVSHQREWGGSYNINDR